MMKRVSWIGAALAAASVMSISGVAAASSHREAPAISEDPAADNTDLYAWVQGTNLVILANYIPLEEPAGGPNFHKFSDDVLYEIHIVRGPDKLDDALTYQFRFKSAAYVYNDPAALNPTPAGGNEFFSQIAGGAQTYTVTKIDANGAAEIAKDVPVAPPNIGPRTNSIAYGIKDPATYDSYALGPNFLKALPGIEGTVFAGPRDDGFYVDLGAVFDLAGLQSVLGQWPARDNVAGYNVHTIALQIPLNVANGGVNVNPGQANDKQTIGVWASASRRKVTIRRKNDASDNFGPWVQVSRLGLPLVNEALIGLQDKDKYNRTHPRNDAKNFGPYFSNPILVRDAEFAGFYGSSGPLAGVDPAKMRTNRTDIIDIINLKASGHAITSVGDVLRVDLGTASAFPNGRKVNPGMNTEEDVTDILLSVILTGGAVPVQDGANHNDKPFLNTFPYLATPWEGAREGHGKETP